MWQDWAGHLGVVDPDGMARFVRTGNLVFDTPDVDVDRITSIWRDLGIGWEALRADDVRARFPSLDLGRYAPPKRVDDPAFADDPAGDLDAIFEPSAGFVDDPMLAAHNLAHAARHHGATFRFRTTVVGVRRDVRRIVGVDLDDGETILAPVVVNVGGPHSARLNEMAGVADEVAVSPRPLRQEVFTIPAPIGMRVEDGMPIIADLDVGQYFRPHLGGTLLVGGTEPACDALHWVDDPDQFDEHPTVAQFETTMFRLARRCPEIGIPHRPTGLAALYDASADWVPVYDRSSLDGWFMAAGTSGNQFKNAPLAGMFIRALVDAADRGHDHDAEPVRVRGRRTGLEIDLGAFSRRRLPVRTTGTVMG